MTSLINGILFVPDINWQQAERKPLAEPSSKSSNTRTILCNSYTRTLFCFVQLFIVSNRDRTYYFINNARHFAFNAEEQFLPIYEHARTDNVVSGFRFIRRGVSPRNSAHDQPLYEVLVASEQKLLMMRPYQIYAVKNIVDVDGGEESRQRLHLAHHGQRDAIVFRRRPRCSRRNPTVDKCLSLLIVQRPTIDPRGSSTISRRVVPKRTRRS
ncbi:MAG: hypothetical protein U0744_20460 [Gemmataceae bacterium]